MTRKERAGLLIDYFRTAMPTPETELRYSNPFELLVAVILSAQCTDKRVNMVTEELFRQFPDPYVMSRASFEEIFDLIKSISYPNNKAKHLLGMSKRLVEVFAGKVPETMNDLVSLPGVGRKTANVILSVIYNEPAFAVDTHVFRVSKRLGLANKNSKTPLQVEEQLMKYIPKEEVPKAHHWLILHGRYTCLARGPKCDVCGITHLCKSFPTLKKEENGRTESE